MATIDAVVFDIGRVLLNWDPEGYYDRRIGRAAREALFAAVDLEGMNLRSDKGEDIAALVEEYAAAHPAHADLIRLWHSDWLQMAHSLIPGSVRLLRALRSRGVPVYALTNFGERTLAMADAAYPALTEFDDRFVSATLRAIKPDPEIYARLETETGVAPERLFFTDDRPENIEAARARGWQGHLFEGPKGLARRLVAERLLPEDAAAV
ncbi:HAD family phosphatase [Psychromarinibacter sp. C21-152]|uniref:HAD family phosphatase n=1 Tax=Psychromarinibacter sediminicola TaxID=3033385 RepID=A0AAE3T7T1_9RHOB|nr:HAD family phosphatase [Psychromarinibacter sediminicola]MDF0600650.1 HAD family phosphatase [Psychromarinibacter sediminicola]